MSGTIKYTNEEKENLARVMWGEDRGAGSIGMRHVGSVVRGRVYAGGDKKNCPDFATVHSLHDAIFQKSPGAKYHQFNAVDSPSFYNPPNPDALEDAQQVLDGWSQEPSKHALWFEQPPKGQKDCEKQFYGENLAGAYGGLCYYTPKNGTCPGVYLK